MPALHALILAAGAGERMGEPKATLVVHGETLLARQVRLLRAAGVAHITAVLSPLHSAAHDEARRVRVNFVLNPDPSRGMSSSVRCGAESFAAKSPLAPVLLLPVDCAFARMDDVVRMLKAMEQDPSPGHGIWRPSFRGRSGHPILIGAAFLPALAALDPCSSMRAFIQSRHQSVRWVAVENPLLHRDLDHPADIADLPAMF